MTYAESETVELKAELVSDICKEIIAFANSRGGTLYVGIADDGTVVGVVDADTTMLRLNNMVRDSILPCSSGTRCWRLTGKRLCPPQSRGAQTGPTIWRLRG